MLLIPHTGGVVMRNYGRTVSQADGSISPCLIGSVGTFVRRSLLKQIGGFDEKIGHKVDDLDLGWRLWLTGYQTVSLPSAITYHWGAKPNSARPISSLKSEIYFHRMPRVFIKNYEARNVFKYLPWLISLNLIRSLKHALSGNLLPLRGFLTSLVWTLSTLPDTLNQRRAIQRNRKISDSFLMKKIMIPGNFFHIWNRYVLNTHKIAETIFS